MPCESETMDSSQTSQPELENSAITKTIQNSSDADENLCSDETGSPYVRCQGPGPGPGGSSMLPNSPSSASATPYGSTQRGNALYVPQQPMETYSLLQSSSSDDHAVPSASSYTHFTCPSGAFRFVPATQPKLSAPTQGVFRDGFHGSAFVPADARYVKNPKIEQPDLSDNSTTSQGGGPPTLYLPERVKREGIVQVATMELNSITPDPTRNSDRTTPPEENGRTLRKAKKRVFSDNLAPCCPVCGVTVRPSELPSHFHHEVCRLEKVARNVQRPSRENTPIAASPSGSKTRVKDTSTGDQPLINTPESRWEAYERIKNNRNSRLTARANRGKSKEDTTCPICSEKVSGTPEELNSHVELCLKRKESSSDDEAVDVEGDENFEEYDWGGETRIRATSLVQGGLSSLGFQTCKKNSAANEDDEDLDLNVDGDDTLTFGRAQYSEFDIIPCRTDVPSEDKAREELRQAVLSETATTCNAGGIIGDKWSKNEETEETTSEREKNGDSTHLISSLKQRIAELEAPNMGKLKCLICMETYSKPVVSISCWHVHCEECWLRTLGVKKLCPQCNTITSPSDLRVVYL